MQTKHLIYLGIFAGSTIGGVLGSMLDHGNGFGFWILTLGTVGSFAGIWTGYKLGNM